MFASFCRGPPPSEPAVGYVPPYIVLHVDCTAVCQKYIQRYNAKYIRFKKLRIHTNNSYSPPSNGITDHVPDFFNPLFNIIQTVIEKMQSI